MNGLVFPVLVLAIVVFAGWKAIHRRHSSRTPMGAGFLFAVLAAYFAWIAGWSNYVVTFLFPNVPLVIPIFGWLLVLGFGLYFAIRRIENEAIFHSDKYNGIKIRYVWAIRILLIATYAILPAIAFVTLKIYSGNYEGEVLGNLPLVFFDRYLEMFWSAYWEFLAVSWWPLPILHFLFSREVIYAPTVRKRVFIPMLISLCLFFSPHAFMLYVLAFDILELDYQIVHDVYLYYFLALAPAIGIPLGLASWYGFRGVAKILDR